MNLTAAESVARAGRLYPALILHGGTVEGRRQAAVRLARVLLCEVALDERPCDRCRHCQRITWPDGSGERFHPDFLVLERDLKTATSVESTKTFLQTAQVSPFEARGQVFVIASAETLTGEAANALLKTLEEPHRRAPRHFMLLAPSRFDLLPTVRSRSMALYLGTGEVLDEEVVDRLAGEFTDAVGAHHESGSAIHLMAAAAVLEQAGGWEDPRAAGPWNLAAAAVLKAVAKTGDAARRRRLLALAEELLGGPRMRIRGVSAQRILEGLVVGHLSCPPTGSSI
ncbi:MAG: hypothetical protein WBG96_17840 [Thermoanaerobaculia bacterium]